MLEAEEDIGFLNHARLRLCLEDRVLRILEDDLGVRFADGRTEDETSPALGDSQLPNDDFICRSWRRRGPSQAREGERYALATRGAGSHLAHASRILRARRNEELERVVHDVQQLVLPVRVLREEQMVPHVPTAHAVYVCPPPSHHPSLEDVETRVLRKHVTHLLRQRSVGQKLEEQRSMAANTEAHGKDLVHRHHIRAI